MVASALNALTFYKMGADPLFINVATGIDSPARGMTYQDSACF
jgi:hypothetical protein